MAQQPWIQNLSVRENILFGEPFEEAWYYQVLEACQLMQDMKLLPRGDHTEIGEKGINLSGGQKQRVALARAVYARRDVYILDDVLSAVDVHVGQRIFSDVLQGLLRGKTILAVTHQLQYLSRFDKILIMDNMKVVESGSYVELMDKGGMFRSLIEEFGSENDPSNAAETEEIGKMKEEAVSSSAAENDGKIIAKEVSEVGKVKVRKKGTFLLILFKRILSQMCLLHICRILVYCLHSFWFCSSQLKELEVLGLVTGLVFGALAIPRLCCTLHSFGLGFTFCSAVLELLDHFLLGKKRKRSKKKKKICFHLPLSFRRKHCNCFICSVSFSFAS